MAGTAVGYFCALHYGWVWDVNIHHIARKYCKWAKIHPCRGAHKYAEEVIPDPVWKRPTTTPLPVTVVCEDPEKKVTLNAAEHKAYRGIIGKIMWMACTTRPDLSYAAAFLSRSLAAPTAGDYQLADRCAAYIKETASAGPRVSCCRCGPSRG